METNVRYTTAGAFVLILLSFIVGSILWLSVGFSTERYSYYIINMDESISGLSKDGPVEFNGVEVGTVDQIKINKKNIQLIELTIKIKSDTPVTFGTKAKLGMRALSGVAYILLEDKGMDTRPLVTQPGQLYPEIATTPSVFVHFDEMLARISISFEQLSVAIQSLLNEKNLVEIAKLLESSRKSMHLLETETLPATNKAMHTIGTETLPAANKAIRMLEVNALPAANKTMQAIQIETIPATNKALNSFSSMSQELSSVATEIKEDPAMLIRGKEQVEILGPGEK